MSDDRPLLVALRALGLGDTLTAVPALRALDAAFPDHRRVLAAPAVFEPLVRRATGFEVVNAAPLSPLPGALHHAEVAVNLHGRGPESHAVLLDAYPRALISFRNDRVPESASGPPWRPDEHEVFRLCRLLEESDVPADPDLLDIPPLPAPEHAAGATLIHPGAASAARRWPPERWSAVAKSEADRGRRVLVTGDASERSLALSVARLAGLPEGCVLAARTTLTELAALVGSAGRVVCADTGVAHLATAFGTPSVVLFGPTSPEKWGPPPGRPRHRALWTGREGDPHADRPDRGLLEISIPDVLGALEDLPDRTEPPPKARQKPPAGVNLNDP